MSLLPTTMCMYSGIAARIFYLILLVLLPGSNVLSVHGMTEARNTKCVSHNSYRLDSGISCSWFTDSLVFSDASSHAGEGLQQCFTEVGRDKKLEVVLTMAMLVQRDRDRGATIRSGRGRCKLSYPNRCAY
ncbi:uncharacterized protein B0H64DRAFT_212219 [Chaetomium fimeti]|uniref:Uncharacterized protein n=1 Tax=Chaetomium fimeti TaxID=1854472 RepID=A0AAE0HBA9_9PEZI|nr:hypothetical protein B0H64DRAFT_212219 [Chaetomium fimeti]